MKTAEKTDTFQLAIEKADIVMYASGRSIPNTWGERYADQPYYIFKNVCNIDIFTDIILVFDDFAETSQSNAYNEGIVITKREFLNPNTAHHIHAFKYDAKKVKDAIIAFKKSLKLTR